MVNRTKVWCSSALPHDGIRSSPSALPRSALPPPLFPAPLFRKPVLQHGSNPCVTRWRVGQTLAPAAWCERIGTISAASAQQLARRCPGVPGVVGTISANSLCPVHQYPTLPVGACHKAGHTHGTVAQTPHIRLMIQTRTHGLASAVHRLKVWFGLLI